MKKLVIAAALIGSAMTAQAASNWDGLYNCNVTSLAFPGKTLNTYISINSNPTGTRAIYTVSAVQPNSVVFGGGYGVITNNTFSGYTSTFTSSKISSIGKTFNLTIDKSNVVRGNVNITSAENTNISVNATVACARVTL
jgi:hypothetical protein